MALGLSECNTTVPFNVSRFSAQLKQSNRTNRDQTSNSFNTKYKILTVFFRKVQLSFVIAFSFFVKSQQV